MEVHVLLKVFMSLAAIGFLGILARLYHALVVTPNRLRSSLKKQGISGPPPKFLLGNILEIKRSRDAVSKAATTEAPDSHNCGSALLPFFDPWRKQYGDVFMFALGNTQILHVTEPDMVREITTCTSLDLGKPSYQAKERGALLGQGILTSNGAYWAHQRKILAPELYMDKVKGMYNLIQESTVTMINSWKSIVESQGGIAEIKIDQHMRSFSGDVISRACFGSNFSKGEEIFLKLRALQEESSKKLLATGIPGMRLLPTKSNREQWALEKEIRTLILQVVKERNEVGYEKDLLQMVLEGAKSGNFSQETIDSFIVDNCKNIYLAGYETTAVSAVWCLMLLASNPEWQDRVRAEALEVCKGQIPDADMVRKMKQLTMVINESLRLYPPVAVVSREAFKDMKFGEINVPKGVNVWTLVTTLHTDPEIWGQDSYKFNPGRFANGITGACKLPHLYMPFGVGPRVCLGQNLAQVELKILVSLIVANFSFSLSPNYVHKPALNLVIEPGNGVDLLIKKLCLSEDIRKRSSRPFIGNHMEVHILFKVLMSLGVVGLVAVFLRLYHALVVTPNRLRSLLKKQGVSGPPPKFLLGNILEIKKSRDAVAKVSTTEPPVSHNCGAALLPFFDPWRKQYGDVFMFALGNTQILYVTQPDMVREITTCTSLDLGKPSYQAKERGALLGQGILTSNGAYWAHQRKILAPELYMEKVKGMYTLIQESTVTLLNSWENIVESQGGVADIKIDQHMRSFSGDVISRACFGSNFSKGEEIFLRLRALQEESSKKVLATGIPGMRLLPTKSNREQWALEKEIRTLILQVVKERNEAKHEKDLLQMVLEGAKNSNLSQDTIDRFIVDNCKNIYLAGYETTAVSATWCLMLLASNQEWQDRVRAEVVEVCKGRIPDTDMVRKMKQLTVVINESLRLYPPVAVVSREAFKDMKFGDINVPKGVNIWTLVTALHTDPDIWGPDAYKFKPDRFANGITVAVFLRLYHALLVMPNRLRSLLKKQGVSGPPPKFLLGNILEIKKSRDAVAKGMYTLIQESTVTLPNSWENVVESQGGVADIKIDQHMRSFSGDVISRASFGSNFSKGEEIFLRHRALQEESSKKLFATGIPGMRLLPTKSNREQWALEKEIRTLILQVVKEMNEAKHGKDLLQMVLEGAKNSNLSQDTIDRFIVDNCKNIYLAGYETTAVLAAWFLMLLASNQEWQDRVRTEVVEVCKGQIPDTDMVRKMKQAFKDMKFGNINVPKGVKVWTLVTTLHTDPDIWGPDAYKFKPDRFANGITGACKLPHLYMPFEVGPRVCLGQNLALVELKILISLIVANFSFSLSPKYVHKPALNLVIEPGNVKIFVSFAAVAFLGLVLRLYNALVKKPARLRSMLAEQGISGPPPTVILGNILEIKKSRGATAKPPMCGPPAEHNCANALFSFFEQWQKRYGEVFMFSLGNTQILHVTQPDMVKEITTCTSLDLGKPSYQAKERGALLGQGVLTSNGAHWAHQRKVIAPELYMDKVKGMYNLITESTMTLLDSWKNIIDAQGGIADIKIDQHMRSFSGDVISRACFGSNFSKGEEIFLKLRALQEESSKKVLATGIPGMRYLPTKSNREQWSLEKEIRTLILQVVKERNEAKHEKDLLQSVLEGAKNSDLSQDAINSFIVDNCKNIYLAGYETTAVSATWCLMLLASNPEWQARVRAEALEVCKGQVPNADMVRKMKQLTMVINESLRLYPPVAVVSREAFKDMKFGNINIPEGVNLWTFVLTIHTDPEIWGEDAYQFNPDRFANGITGACKLPHLYMPFGVGPRVCLGQNLALVELKILISLIVSNFSFSLSPTYIHSPSLNLVIEPQHGVNLYLKKL
ncbi:hypothetical protein RJ639_041290 [Escallonia herrerae]|uniref:Cytochrome P450 n=1 Tax=Escallonia herrerae TaxID=1293975 RepID=A0AA88WE05_9ASTE|nr:hypothetical protein RJ639_041290 [Escallonia herrerae]